MLPFASRFRFDDDDDVGNPSARSDDPAPPADPSDHVSEDEMLAKLAEDDAVLLRRFDQSRDEAAFDELSRRYRAMVVDVARRVLRNAHDAEDLAQMTFLELAADPGRVRDNLPGWLRTVAVRKAVRWQQQRARRVAAEATATEGRPAWTSPEQDESDRLVRLSVEGLPPYLRTPFDLRFRQGLTLDQVAAAVRDTRRSVSARIEQAVVALRQELTAGAISAAALGAGTASAGERAFPPGVRADLPGNAPRFGAAVAVARAGGRGGRPTARSWLPPAGKAVAAAAAVAVALAAALVAWRLGPTSAGQGSAPPPAFDRLAAAWTGRVAPEVSDDPLGFPALVGELSTGPHHLWRGTNVLLLDWCRTNAKDWWAEEGNRVQSPGLVRLESVGTYMPGSPDSGGEVGLLDLDDGARLPFQFDLLQAIVSVRLAARRVGGRAGEVDASGPADLAVFEGYQAGYAANGRTPRPPAVDGCAAALVARAAAGRPALVARYVLNDRFRSSAVGGDGGRLFPTPGRGEPIASALERVFRQSTVMRRAFRFHGPGEVRGAVLDVARRVSTAGGLKEYLVLLRRPFRDNDRDAIVVVRREVAPTAERMGLAEAGTAQDPARRVAERWLAAARPWPALANWIELEDGRYHVALLEPAEGRLSTASLRTQAEVRDAGRLLGYLLGRYHRASQDVPAFTARLKPAQFAAVTERAEAYLLALDADHVSLSFDPRTKHMVAQVARVAADPG